MSRFFETSRHIDAAAQPVWVVISDVARWPEWTPTIDAVEPLDGGPLRVGWRAKVRQPKLPQTLWQVTEVADGRSFTWESRAPGPGAHRVTDAAAGLRRTTARARLLDTAIEHFGRHGIGDTSLRGIAEAVGTSHRMLIYHFGSREGLLAEVTREVEARQRAAMTAAYDAGLPPLEAAAKYWEDTVEAALRYGPLFFELAAHAMQGKEHAAALRDELIAAWLPPVIDLCRALGLPEAQAEAHARLALGAARGLLLDLLVSGDREQVGRAAELLNRLLLLSAEVGGA